MSYKIIDKKTKQAVINYSFESWNGGKTNNAQFITLSDNKSLLFSSKKDAQSMAKRLGNNFKVVGVTK